MKSSWFLKVIVLSCISLAAADDTTSIPDFTQLSSCANSCLEQSTQCALNDTLCVCHDIQLTNQVQRCLVSLCSLADGMEFEQSLESSCPSYQVPSQQKLVLIITLSFSGTAALLATVRILLQIHESQKIYAENWFLLLAVTCQAALAALFSLAVYDGFGKHVLDISPGLLRQGLIFIFSATPVYWLTLLMTRLSVVAFLRRINHAKGYRICTVAMMTFIVIWGVLIIVLSILQCRPISYDWNMVLQINSSSSVTHGSCFNFEILEYISSAISLFQDVLIFLLAVPLLWMLQWAPKRFGACLIVLVGLFVCAAAALRLRSLVTFSSTTLDPTFSNIQAIYWSAIETSTGIILICLPILGGRLMRMNCGCLDFPENFFGRNSETNTTRYTGRPWSMHTRNTIRENVIEHKFEIRDHLTLSKFGSIGSLNSLQRLALSVNNDRPGSKERPGSILTNSTDTREHLSRTYGKHDRHSYILPPAITERKSKRLASPTQGIFRDMMWRETPVFPSTTQTSRPLPQPPIYNQPLHPKPLRLSHTASILSLAPSENSETRIPCTKSRQPSISTVSLPDSIRSTISEPTDLITSHILDSGEPRAPLQPPPAAALRNASSQPSLRPRKVSPKARSSNTMSVLTTGPVHEQTILEHQDESLLGRIDMGREEGNGLTESISRIQRTNSGMAIEFNGQILRDAE